MSARKLLCEAIDIVEVAVGLVLVFLVELVVVEAFVIELGGFGSRRRDAVSWLDIFISAGLEVARKWR